MTDRDEAMIMKAMKDVSDGLSPAIALFGRTDCINVARRLLHLERTNWQPPTDPAQSMDAAARTAARSLADPSGGRAIALGCQERAESETLSAAFHFVGLV